MQSEKFYYKAAQKFIQLKRAILRQAQDKPQRLCHEKLLPVT
jgi:hypothetical protein